MPSQHAANGHDGVFRFMDLPSEIRAMILSHTGLIFETEMRGGQSKAINLIRLPLWPLFYRRGLSLPWLRCGPCPGKPDECLLNFICLRCSEPRCKRIAHHGSGPAGLFLTSKQIRREALDVFFTKNQFVVHFDAAESTGVGRALKVLDSIPPEQLYLLRMLCIDGLRPPIRENYQERIYTDWVRIFAFLRVKANPKLVLKIYFSKVWRDSYEAGWKGNKVEHPELREENLRRFCDFLRKLGLKRVSVLTPNYKDEKDEPETSDQANEKSVLTYFTLP